MQTYYWGTFEEISIAERYVKTKRAKKYQRNKEREKQYAANQRDKRKRLKEEKELLALSKIDAVIEKSRAKYKTFFDLVEKQWFKKWYEEEYGEEFSIDWSRVIAGSRLSKPDFVAIDIGDWVKRTIIDVKSRISGDYYDQLTLRTATITDYLDGKVPTTIRRPFIQKFASPIWRDKEKIKNIYKNRDLLNDLYPHRAPFHVDHIIPIQGDNVSGLHVSNNLRIIPKKENILKSNSYYEHIDEYCWSSVLTNNE